MNRAPAGRRSERGLRLIDLERAAEAAALLLRKEVIQPHLPIRLPCYDLVPITGTTFGDCPPCGLAHRLRVEPAFVT
jgi:hypothetical protein